MSAGEKKLGDSFDLFAFTDAGVRGLIVKGQELAAYCMSP